MLMRACRFGLWASLLPLALLVGTGCGGGGGAAAALGVVIGEPEPAGGFAPLDVTWRAEVEGAAPGEAFAFTWSFGDGATRSTFDAAVEHTYAEPGLYDVTVVARSTTRTRSTSATRSFEVLRAGDSVATRLAITPLAVQGEQPVRATLSILRREQPRDLALPVAFFAVAESNTTVRDTMLAVELRQALDAAGAVELGRAVFTAASDAAGEAVQEFPNLRFPPQTPTGRYRVLAFLDPEATLTETNPRNNGAFAQGPVTFRNPVADAQTLQVRNLRARPARTNVLSRVTVDGEIANTGDDPALFVTYELWLSAGDAVLNRDEDIRIGDGRIQNLPAAGSFRLEGQAFDLDQPISTLGDYYVLLTATTQEAGEAGRVVGASNAITVTDEAVAGVDIVPRGVSLQPATTFVGGTVVLRALIANEGREDVNRSFQCNLYLLDEDRFDEERSDQIVTSITVRTLASNEEVEVEDLFLVTELFPEGTYFPFLFCNPNFVIPESDRLNNVRRADEPLRINAEAIVDLVVRDVTVTSAAVEEGDSFDVSFNVCNEGTDASTPTTVAVALSTNDAFDVGDRVLGTTPLASLQAGSCVTTTLPLVADCDTFVSTYSLLVVADPGRLVEDVNRNNNVGALAEPFRVTGPICACEPDPFEPNNTPARAVAIDPAGSVYPNLSMCDEASDWYRVALVRGESIRIVSTYDRRRGNIDMILYDTDRTTVLSASRGNAGREEVSYISMPRTGTYFLHVVGRTPQDRNLYDLSFSVTPQVPGTDLVPLNIRPSITRAVPGQRVDVSIDVVNLGDIPAPQVLARLYLVQDANARPTEGVLLDTFTVSNVVERRSVTRVVHIPREDAGGERFFLVHVNPRADVEEVDYDNNLGVSGAIEVDAGCSDPFEPNNDLGAAATLPVSPRPEPWIFENLRTCSGNPDFYRVCADAGERLAFRADFDPRDGDIDLRLYNAQLRVIERSETSAAFEEISLPYVATSACFVLEAYVVGPNRQVPYTLTVARDEADPSLRCNPRAEPNDVFANAAQLRDHLNADLSLCPEGDVDFFRIPLAAGQPVRFQLTPASGRGAVPSTLRLSLWSPAQAFLASTATAAEALRHTPAVAGNYFLRVVSNGTGEREMPYRIVAEGISGIDLFVDDLRVEPTDLIPGREVSLSFVLGNARDAASPATSADILLSPVPFRDGRAQVVRQLSLPPLAGFSTRGEGTKFTVPSSLPFSGPAFLLVLVDPNATVQDLDRTNNLGVIPIDLRPPCLADLAEPNSVYLDAYPLQSLPAGTTLSLCPGDEDWFYLEGAPGAAVTIDLLFEHARGDLDLFVYDSALNLRGRGDSVTDNEAVTTTFPAGNSRLYIQVVGFRGASNTYQLRTR